VLLSRLMKALVITVRLEDSADPRAARQFLMGAASNIPGFRECLIGEHPQPTGDEKDALRRDAACPVPMTPKSLPS
jgi:hypothetical protein